MTDTIVISLDNRRGVPPFWEELPVMRDRWLTLSVLGRAARRSGRAFHINLVVTGGI